MLEYVFDSGNTWRFNVRLEKIGSKNSKIRGPVVIDWRGQAPPQYPDHDLDDWGWEEE
jgi:hypothetical protein